MTRLNSLKRKKNNNKEGGGQVSIISDFLEFQRKEKAGKAVNIYFLQATS